jgi:hypothetical protein
MPETGLHAPARILVAVRDRAGDADAAEDGGGDVGDALRHHLHIAAMLAAGHGSSEDASFRIDISDITY